MKKYYDLYFHDSHMPLTDDDLRLPAKGPKSPFNSYDVVFWCLLILVTMGICYGSCLLSKKQTFEFYPTPPPVDSSIAIHVYKNASGEYSLLQAMQLREHYGLPVIVLPYSERPDRAVIDGDTLKAYDAGGLLNKYGSLEEIFMFVANDDNGSLKQWETTRHYYQRSKKGDPLRHTGWDEWEHGDLNKKTK